MTLGCAGGESRNRVVRRGATGKPAALSVVSRNLPPGEGSDPVEGALAGDVNAPAEPIAAVIASLLAGIREARSPLAAELVAVRGVRGGGDRSS
jgi:hypothetical protein